MESADLINNSQPFKNASRNTPQRAIITTVILILAVLFLFSLLQRSLSYSVHAENQRSSTPSPSATPLQAIIKNACATTPNPSLCLVSLSSIPEFENVSSSHTLLELAINETKKQVSSVQTKILGSFTAEDLNFNEHNALEDCKEMLDQTLYELGQAISDLQAFPSSVGYLKTSYSNLKTLLSAAMTNENTCIEGFSDLENSDLNGHNGLKQKLQKSLSPISTMISNILAVVNYMDMMQREEVVRHPRILTNRVPEDGLLLSWMTRGDRRLTERQALMRPNVIVARDGSGHYKMIGEAIKNAPNMSLERYVIKIKAGIYTENVVVTRQKINIMLIGDGMNSTVIKGSRNFVDGFSTFTSATLTVIGDRFLAKDLKIINTAGPEKHQAVALRVTSNAAFYRCEISSYQDTLYAHSLRQFYSECRIQGTIDFIFGNADAVFQKCQILVRKPGPGQRNMITAQGRQDPNQNTGISLQNCTIVAAPDFAAMTKRSHIPTYLGRPWRNYSRTIVMKSYLGGLIHPAGWYKWDQYSTVETTEYIEYMNYGPGSDTKRRVKWAKCRKNCSEEIARRFKVGEFLRGTDEWFKFTVFPLFDSLNKYTEI